MSSASHRPCARVAAVVILLAAYLALLPATVLALDRQVIAEGQSSLDLTPNLQWFYDADSRDDAHAMFERGQRNGFEALPAGRPNFGFREGAFWFRAVVENQNPRDTRWLLVQAYPLSDYIDLYLRYPDGRIEHRASGDRLPFSTRAIKYRHPNFWVDLPQGEQVQILLRVKSESSMQVPLTLYTPAAFAELARDAQLGIGIYYGILLALFFYNLILWLMLRDASYFWYMFHISAFGLVLFCLNGLAFEYLWPNNIWLQDKAVPLSICLAQIGMQQFARNFLELDRRWVLGDRVGLGLIGFFVLLGVASLFLPYRISTPLASAAVLPSVLWIVTESIVVLRRGYAPARLFLLAWSMFLLGTFAFTLVAFGVLPKLFITEYGVQIGSALEMILLSFALAYRYAALRNENDRIVRDANEQLERNVAARTMELSGALEQLAEANARLRESNRRDGLTGVFNRHYFRDMLEKQLVEARTGRQHLAVLMVDVDHFKRINDRLGHLAGDECLRIVARAMSDVLGRYDAVVARFGGEEFVASLPGLTPQEAVVAAEELRRRIASEAILVAGEAVRLTVSIGVHAMDVHRVGNPEDALKVADEALYTAKEQGRNCVRQAVVA